MTGIASMAKRLCLAVGVAAMLASGACSTGNQTDWTAPGVLTVVQRDGKLLLAKITVSPPSVRTLAQIPASVSPSIVPESAIVSSSPTESLLLVNDGTMFGARVIRVDLTARAMSTMGTVAAGRFPSLQAGDLTGTEVLAGEQPFARSYSVPGLTLSSSAALRFVPSAGDAGCLVGQSPDAAARGILFQRRTAGSIPTLLAREAAPGGIACRAGLVVASIAAHDPSGVAAASGTQLAPDNRLVILRGNEPASTLVVGTDPGAVAIISPSLLAVDISAGAGRAIAFVDLSLGKVVRTVALDRVSHVSALGLFDGRLIVLGGQRVVIVPVAGGQPVSLSLDGSSTTYLLPSPPANPGA